jgi:hypothetical protein
MRKFTPILVLMFWLVTVVGFSQDQWQERRTRHFIIYFKQVPSDFIDSVENAAENYYIDITRDLGFTRDASWVNENRVKIYIYNDKDDYVAGGGGKSWSHGTAFCDLREIRTFPSAHGFFDSTLPHELGHIIFREYIGPNITIPTWFEEGVAMFQEKGKRWGAHKVVKNAIEEKKFLTLMELFKVRLYNHTEKQLVELFYAESASVVYYIIEELGQHRFLRFCQRLRESEAFRNALPGAYAQFRNIEDLNRNWLNYLERQ